MPNLWTHILFAEEIAKKSNIDTSEFRNAFRFGAQGPDPFFYYNFWPWLKDKSVTRIGGKIHTEHCGEFLIEMLKLVREKNDQLAKYYALGFIAHHVLDRNAHPYIIYKSGEEGNKHQVLETTLDTILAQEYLGIETWTTPIYKEIYLGESLPNSINSLIVTLLKQVHKLSGVDNLFNHSYQQMQKALKVLYDPMGYKNLVLGKMISPYSHQKTFPDRDYLNLMHKEWYHPADLAIKSTESFYDILARAEEEGTKIFSAIDNYFNGENNLEAVKALIGDISYESGLPCGTKYELKYFDPIV